jgi:hypothetical protein
MIRWEQTITDVYRLEQVLQLSDISHQWSYNHIILFESNFSLCISM